MLPPDSVECVKTADHCTAAVGEILRVLDHSRSKFFSLDMEWPINPGKATDSERLHRVF